MSSALKCNNFRVEGSNFWDGGSSLQKALIYPFSLTIFIFNQKLTHFEIISKTVSLSVFTTLTV